MYMSCKEKWSKISTEKHITSALARNTAITRRKKCREMKREIRDEWSIHDLDCFSNLWIDLTTMMLSTCSGLRHVRRSFTMKPAELKHFSTADEEAGIQWICFARIDRIGYSPWWSLQNGRGFDGSFFLSMLIARYRDSSSGGGGTKGKSSLPELPSWSTVWLSFIARHLFQIFIDVSTMGCSFRPMGAYRKKRKPIPSQWFCFLTKSSPWAGLG